MFQIKYFLIFFILINFYLIKTNGNFSFGGWSPIDINSEDVNVLAMIAVGKFNSESNEKVEFSGVSNALQQVVAGMKYKLIIKTTLENCQNSDGCIKYLDATIFKQPWTDTEEITIEVIPPVNQIDNRI